jgi:hypothetical protein
MQPWITTLLKAGELAAITHSSTPFPNMHATVEPQRRARTHGRSSKQFQRLSTLPRRP